MRVKNTATVEAYVRNKTELEAALENLLDFVRDLPAPDDAGHLPSPIHYGHTGDVARIHESVGEAARIADEFNK